MVYVDDAGIWSAGRLWFHMMADTDDELEEMARKLDLNGNWRHGDHYELTANKRKQALTLGAKPITSKEMVELRRKRKVSCS